MSIQRPVLHLRIRFPVTPVREQPFKLRKEIQPRALFDLIDGNAKGLPVLKVRTAGRPLGEPVGHEFDRGLNVPFIARVDEDHVNAAGI